MKISEKWKRPLRLVIVTIIITIILLINNYGIKFTFHFDFQSIPAKKDIPPPAIRATDTWVIPES